MVGEASAVVTLLATTTVLHIFIYEMKPWYFEFFVRYQARHSELVYEHAEYAFDWIYTRDNNLDSTAHNSLNAQTWGSILKLMADSNELRNYS